MKSIHIFALFCFLTIFLVINIGCSCGDDDDDDDSSADDDDDTTADDDDDDNDDDSTSAPVITDSEPADGEIELKLGTVVTLIFSKSMNTDSVESAFSLEDGFKATIPGSFVWSSGDMVMTFTPNNDLIEGTLYTVSLTTSAQSTEGTPMDVAFETEFTTVDLWVLVQDGGETQYDEGEAITAGQDGYFYATGTVGTVSGEDLWIQKIGYDGTIEHTEEFDGADHEDDDGLGITTDSAGNIYVTGSLGTATASNDIWVRKYDSSWNDLWTDSYGGSGTWWDYGESIVVDDSGNVYVTGVEQTSLEFGNVWVRKYDSTGTILWTKTHNGPDSTNDRGFSIALDGSGGLYVTGTEGSSTELNNVFLRKYDLDGNTIWTDIYNDADDQNDTGYGVAVDSMGDIIVAGYDYGLWEGDNVWVRKYDSDGNEIWTETYNYKDFNDHGNAVAIDSEDNIIVAGYQNDPDKASGYLQAIIRKYDTDGNLLWHYSYDGADTDDSVFEGVCVDQYDNIVAIGIQMVVGNFYDILIVKLDPDGNDAV